MNDLIKVSQNNDANKENKFAAFRSYDIRGIYPDELDTELAYKLTKAFKQVAPGKRYVVARDMRDSSPTIEKAVIQALQEEDCTVDSIGVTTTDNLYFAVGEHDYDGGLMITASHNSSLYNGLKYVKKGVVPVQVEELKQVFTQIESNEHYLPLNDVQPDAVRNLIPEFVEHIKKFADGTKIKPMKIVVDAGNGVAGIVAEKFFEEYPDIELVKLYFEPHADFPHHEPNPALPMNLNVAKEMVKEHNADLGVAFDGDGDRIFFIDADGEAIPGYYIQSLLTEYYLQKNKTETVVYDLRYVRSIESIVRLYKSRGVISKVGHPHIKHKMKLEDAVFGGESTSSHFYYRDNFYADSGIITLQMILKIMSESNNSIKDLVKTYKDRFHISGEKNFHLNKEKSISDVIQDLKREFPDGAHSDYDGFVIDFEDWRFSIRESATEPFIRLNVEANSKETLEAKTSILFGIINKYAEYTGSYSNLYALQSLNLSPEEKVTDLFDNMLYSWQKFKGNFLDDLYGSEWSRNMPPSQVMHEMDKPKFKEFYENNKTNIEESLRLKKTYLNDGTWFDHLCKTDKLISDLERNPIAYFSLEFGIVDWLQIYSGGLGVLAGDFMKEASDSGVPIVGIGLLYSEGYFYQRFTEDGWQLEDYLYQDADDYPLELIRDEDGNVIKVEVKVGENIVKVRGWRLKVGRRSLILLDTNFNENERIDQLITYHLYGGTTDTRIKQEIILGIGGYKFIKAAGINPSLLHLNEGHSAFAAIALAEEIMKKDGISFTSAISKAKHKILFTNHTLKQAGNDLFDYSLVQKYLQTYAEDFKINFRDVFNLGVDPIYANGQFGMTILAMNNASRINAVSKIHSEAAEKIWTDKKLIPVTNGVHMTTWVAESFHDIYDRFITERWNEQGKKIDWNKLDDISTDLIWNAHMIAKRELLKQVKINCGVEISEDSMLIGWFRRVTKYKQPEVMTLDIDRLDQLVNRNDINVRFIFGGKAHPKDENGKKLLQDVWNLMQDPRFKDKIVLIPDYNWRMARYMVSGSDIWMNTPIRYQEACGTSGMKAAANGVIQFSTIDGWIDEIKDKNVVYEIEDNLNPDQFYSKLEQEIIPTFQDREAWVKRMRETIKIALSTYGTDRMMRDYLEMLYKPMLKELRN